MAGFDVVKDAVPTGVRQFGVRAGQDHAHVAAGFATHQPVSLAVNGCRALFNDQPAWGYAWQLIIWIVAICVIFIPLAVRAYRRA